MPWWYQAEPSGFIRHTHQLDQVAAGLVAKAGLVSLLQPGTWVKVATRSKDTYDIELAEIIAYGMKVS
jgi:endonuclease YncB( thermonuclease family)